MTSPSPQQRRQQEQRAQKLEEIRAQVADGTLTVRQMTAAERKQHPKPPPKPASGAKRNYAARQRGR